jgi:hypothetical protein
MATGRPVVNLKLTRPQTEAIQSSAPYVDIEGGLRGSKSTAAHIKAYVLINQHPGIDCLMSRYTDEDTFGELAPRWRSFAEAHGLQLAWNSSEGYDEVVNGPVGVSGHRARVYLRGLRSADTARPYAKVRGLNLGHIHIEQAEELPSGWHGELVGRLSQQGYPHSLWYTPQPVNQDHWIAKLFPETNPDPMYHYIRTNCYENRENLPPGYIEQLEAAYPVGSAQRRTLLEGRRGLAIQGEAVYAGYFHRHLHVSEDVAIDRHTPLIESWDFGHGHPCVSWRQYLTIGRLQVLGAVMGENMFLEDFVPAALRYRAEWCPNPLTIYTTGDPAGLDITNQGVSVSKVRDILAEHGVHPIVDERMLSANRPEIRYQAIQNQSQQMRRFAFDGKPAFLIHPRAVVLTAKGPQWTTFAVDGYEAGYVWDTRAVIGMAAGIRRPKKDGYYDHYQNTEEYATIAFAPAQPTQQSQKKAERAAIRRAQRDDDDRPVRQVAGRGGY